MVAVRALGRLGHRGGAHPYPAARRPPRRLLGPLCSAHPPLHGPLLLNYPREARRSSMWWLICCSLVLTSASRRSPSGPPSLLARRLSASSRRRCCSNSAIRSRISRRQPMCHVLASMIPRGLLSLAHIYPLP